MSSTPSQPQLEALNKAYQILGEHFDCALLVVAWEEDAQPQAEGKAMMYKGGCMSTIGLATWVQHEMLFGNNITPND